VITRRTRLIAKLVWWAAGAPDVLIAACLVMVQEPSFARPDMIWADRWKLLARRLRAERGKLQAEVDAARKDYEELEKVYKSTC
jgi:hypothetical protein